MKFSVTLTLNSESCSLCKEAQHLQLLGLPDHTTAIRAQAHERAV